MFLKLTNTDFVILCVVLLFIIQGARKGLIYEVISAVSIATAGYISYKFGTFFDTFIHQYISIRFISIGLSYVFMFVSIYLLLQYIAYMIFPKLKRNLDMFLGAIFGFLKSSFLIVIMFYLVGRFFSYDVMPEDFRNSKFKKISEDILIFFPINKAKHYINNGTDNYNTKINKVFYASYI